MHRTAIPVTHPALTKERRKKRLRNQRSLQSKSEFTQLLRNVLLSLSYFVRVESTEEGEIESENEMVHPLVTLTKIDPSEIPDVSHKFLMRGDRDKKDVDRDRDQQRDRGFGWSKKSVPQSRSGRTIKGRGNFRYRTPSRSRSRSVTPEHWKAAQRNVIKITEFERLEEQKKLREAEMVRRAEERKRRHEALSKGDTKKSFYELTQEPTVISVASSLTRPVKPAVDLNALDYEESDSDKEKETREKFRKLDTKESKNGKPGTTNIRDRLERRSRSRSRSRRSVKRSQSDERSGKDRRDLRSTIRNRLNDNRRWDNHRSTGRNRLDNDRKRSKDRRSNSRSRSR